MATYGLRAHLKRSGVSHNAVETTETVSSLALYEVRRNFSRYHGLTLKRLKLFDREGSGASSATISALKVHTKAASFLPAALVIKIQRERSGSSLSIKKSAANAALFYRHDLRLVKSHSDKHRNYHRSFVGAGK